MEPGEFESLANKAPSSHSAAVEFLQAVRVHKIRRPELVLLHGGKVLQGSHRKLGSDVWTILEQVFNAAIELGDDRWSTYCLKKLGAQFPNSTRVERLKGMHMESQENWADAACIYKKILAEKPEDVLAAKRLVSLQKQRGKIPEAIDFILNKYLNTFCTDNDAWHELAEMYIGQGSYHRASFCFEEMLMTLRHSLYHILTYAELQYTLGEYDTSRKYYSMACYLDGSSLRALWGLWAANVALEPKDKTNEKMLQLQTFTLQRLRLAYKGKGRHAELAIEMLKNVK